MSTPGNHPRNAHTISTYAVPQPGIPYYPPPDDPGAFVYNQPAVPVDQPPPAVKLVIRRSQLQQQVDSGSDTQNMARIDNGGDHGAEYTASGRPIRGTRAQRPIIESEEEDEEAFGQSRNTRGSKRRNGRAQQHDGEDEDAFDDTMLDSSPFKQTAHPPARRPGRTRRLAPDPDEEDAAGPGEPAAPSGSRRSSRQHPSAQADEYVEPAPTGRVTRGRKQSKSRGSSIGAESFNPSASGSASDAEGETDIEAELPDDFDSEAASSVASSRPRKTRRRTAAPANVRRSTRNTRRSRQISDDDDFEAPKRQLRERHNRPDYTIPPALDNNTELVPEAVANISGPRRGRGGLSKIAAQFAAAAGSSWANQQMGQAMGDPDSSDSVSPTACMPNPLTSGHGLPWSHQSECGCGCCCSCWWWTGCRRRRGGFESHSTKRRSQFWPSQSEVK